MQGSILQAASAGGQGMILGDDGIHYTFTPTGWQGDPTQAMVGMRVDFEERGTHAVAVYPVPGAAPVLPPQPIYQPPPVAPVQPPPPTPASPVNPVPPYVPTQPPGSTRSPCPTVRFAIQSWPAARARSAPANPVLPGDSGPATTAGKGG